VSEALKGRPGWLATLGLLLAVFIVGWFADQVLAAVFGESRPLAGAQVTWLLGLVVITACTLIAGTAVNGRWSGVLIDSRNRHSLAQVQAVPWLVVVSSAIVAAGVSNVLRATLFAALAPVSLGGQPARIEFPPLDASFVGILALSHAGALGYLAAPHAKTG
jgi:hypothetical protein